MILIHSGLWLMFLSCVRTKDYVYDYRLENVVTEMETKYSYWPSFHNALRMRKREVQQPLQPNTSIQSDGGEIFNSQSVNSSKPFAQAPVDTQSKATGNIEQTTIKNKLEPAKSPVTHTNDTATVVAMGNETLANTTLAAAAPPKQLNLNQPGVVMRGIIVFGGFLIMAVVYYIFYRNKNKKNETGNTHNMNDANQFRYGVLHSDDRRDNLELSRVPLTMESDEDDDDEDLEIFDLGQKKQSLSYVNLQTKDEDVVFQRATENGSNAIDKDNLLLDIEDVSTDPLINWSHNGNKSIL
ncbi:hypothetical protein O0L34_g9015 [Tuta absoluta]|nr:hypothetical protein O0L34_g9015 [Tuta absoluta]